MYTRLRYRRASGRGTVTITISTPPSRSRIRAARRSIAFPSRGTQLFKSLFGRKKPKPSTATPVVETIRDAKVGDVLTVTGLELEYEDRYFIIEKLNRYASEHSEWYELLGVDGDTHIWLSYSGGADQFVTATPDERALGLSQIGVTEDEIVRMDNEHAIDNSVSFDGEVFHYKNSGEVFFFEDNRGEGHGHYLWEFESDDGSRVLSVDKWEGRPFHAYVSDVVPADNVAVYRR